MTALRSLPRNRQQLGDSHRKALFDDTLRDFSLQGACHDEITCLLQDAVDLLLYVRQARQPPELPMAHKECYVNQQIARIALLNLQ